MVGSVVVDGEATEKATGMRTNQLSELWIVRSRRLSRELK